MAQAWRKLRTWASGCQMLGTDLLTVRIDLDG